MFLSRDCRLHYEDIGSGIPLLCLPPFPFDSGIWRNQHSLQDVARLILPDLRGTGKSEQGSLPVTMELLAEDMLALLDALHIASAVVMGVSMGAYVAFAMYAKDAYRFRGLVLADTRAEADSPETAERRRRTVEGLRTQGAGILRERVNDLFAAASLREQPELVESMQQNTARENPEGLAQLTLAMAARLDRVALLPRITVPTLVLCGEDDKPSPPDGMRAMAAQIPDAEFHLIPQAGHLSPLEQPEIFNRYVREYLKSVSCDTSIFRVTDDKESP